MCVAISTQVALSAVDAVLLFQIVPGAYDVMRMLLKNYGHHLKH